MIIIMSATPMRMKSKLVESCGKKKAAINPAQSRIACATARNIFASNYYRKYVCGTIQVNLEQLYILLLALQTSKIYLQLMVE